MSDTQNSSGWTTTDAESERTSQLSGDPSDLLMLLPVRATVLFPGMVVPIAIGRKRSVAAAQQAVQASVPLGVVMQRDDQVSEPSATDLHSVGTIAGILRYVTTPDGTHNLVCQGRQRFRIIELVQEEPFILARVSEILESNQQSPEIEARFLHLKQLAGEALELLPQAPPELVAALQSVTSPSTLADLTAAHLDLKPDEKQEILETIDLVLRMDKVIKFLAGRIEVLRISAEIGQQTKAAFDERQKEAVLREQMAAIQRQLGEGDGNGSEIEGLRGAIAKADMPPEIEKKALKELRRLERMSESSPEHGMVRTYLDRLIELPWPLPEEPVIDLAEARQILDADHFGLDKIKQRIIEFLAVRKLAPQGKAPILCFAGPPGVGKTSLGKSTIWSRCMMQRCCRQLRSLDQATPPMKCRSSVNQPVFQCTEIRGGLDCKTETAGVPERWWHKSMSTERENGWVEME